MIARARLRLPRFVIRDLFGGIDEERAVGSGAFGAFGAVCGGV